MLFGPPGSGKGTQAGFLRDHLKIPQVATGDLMRTEIKSGSELGKVLKEVMDRGGLVPDDITLEILHKRIAQPDCANGILLDGFPRTTTQAEDLDELLASLGQKLDHVIYIRVPLDLLVSRLSGRLTCPTCGRTYHMEMHAPREDTLCDIDRARLVQRDDDSPATARHRISEYIEKTLPVLIHYRAKGCVSNVDGEGEIDEIRKRILMVLEGGKLN